MDSKAAIAAFSQSDKVKSGIIWASQALTLLSGMPESEKKGAEAVLKTMITMIGREVHLARKTTGDTAWMNAEKNIDMALVMMDSGVSHEAAYHLTHALQQVTAKAQQSMSILVDKGLL
jgi:hypothetical protein